eukprot:scaffold27636_cov107-Isochrysis_galbana.AAC.6
MRSSCLAALTHVQPPATFLLSVRSIPSSLCLPPPPARRVSSAGSISHLAARISPSLDRGAAVGPPGQSSVVLVTPKASAHPPKAVHTHAAPASQHQHTSTHALTARRAALRHNGTQAQAHRQGCKDQLVPGWWSGTKDTLEYLRAPGPA